MTDLIIQGINGRMGHTLVEKISARSDCRIVAGVDQKAGQIGDIPVYASLEDLPEAKGIVIDFTSPAGTVHAAQFCAAHGMPCVLCSTGLSKEDEAVVEQASEKVPVFRSANMSVGINVLIVTYGIKSLLYFTIRMCRHRRFYNKNPFRVGTQSRIPDRREMWCLWIGIFYFPKAGLKITVLKNQDM